MHTQVAHCGPGLSLPRDVSRTRPAPASERGPDGCACPLVGPAGGALIASSRRYRVARYARRTSGSRPDLLLSDCAQSCLCSSPVFLPILYHHKSTPHLPLLERPSPAFASPPSLARSSVLSLASSALIHPPPISFSTHTGTSYARPFQQQCPPTPAPPPPPASPPPAAPRPGAHLLVALHKQYAREPFTTRIVLPRTTGMRTTFEVILRMALLHAEQGGWAVSKDARMVCEVDGIECSLK